MSTPLSRRAWLGGTASAIAVSALSSKTNADDSPSSRPFRYCLNTSTVRDAEGKPRGIVELIEIARKAGYSAIEPWLSELNAYLEAGGTAKELAKRFADAGLAVPDCIGFAEWLVDDDSRRKKGLEQAKRDMALVAEIGGSRMAAPPVGATGGKSQREDPKFSQPVSNLLVAADRYRALFEVGEPLGVTPVVEVWGFSESLKRLGETLMVAAECGKNGACVLPDVYHLYKGGSDFSGLHLLGPNAVGIFHVNDYPDIVRGKITDADRVFPGDGIAPLAEVYRTLHQVGYAGYLSLELFNRDYWKRDPHEVAREGLTKMKQGVEAALAR